MRPKGQTKPAASPLSRLASRFTFHVSRLTLALTLSPLATPTLAAPPITNLHQLKALSRAQAADGIPLQITGVVVCYDAGWHQLYLHDGVETTYFNADDFQPQPELGQVVEITGTALDKAVLTNVNLKLFGKSPLPVAKNLALSGMASQHGEWVQTGGRLLSAENSRGRWALLLNDKK